MDKQERLRERYEDALFAIMMDELASSLGKEAEEENERLKNDPDAAVPEQINKRCLKTIRSHYRKAAARRAGKVMLKTVACFAMTLGVTSALFMGAFAISEDVRLSTMNLIVETFGESTDFYFAPPVVEIPQIKAGWVPEGFELDSEGSDEMSSWFVYKKPDGSYIRGRYSIGEGQLLNVDTENAVIEDIHIHNIEAMLIIKEQKLQIAMVNANETGFIYLFSDGISANELILVAEELKY